MSVPRGMSTTAGATAERKESVRRLSLEGFDAAEVALKVGVSSRTVQRYRAEMVRAGVLRLTFSGFNRWKARSREGVPR